MKRAFLLLAAAAIASCTRGPHYRSESFSQYYKQPASSASTEMVERRQIMHWEANPKDKRRLGFLYKQEMQVPGSRDVREGFVIYNDTATKRLGLVTAEGVFYRFTDDGRIGPPLGEYSMLMGLKIFFGIPLDDNLDLEEPDPFRDSG